MKVMPSCKRLLEVEVWVRSLDKSVTAQGYQGIEMHKDRNQVFCGVDKYINQSKGQVKWMM